MTPFGLHPCHRIAFSDLDSPLRDPLLPNLLHHTLLEAVRGASDLRSSYRAVAVLRVDFFFIESVSQIPSADFQSARSRDGPKKTLRMRAIRDS